MTVVVETRGPLTYVGRYDREDQHGVHLLDAGVHSADSGQSQAEFVQRSAKFGVRSEHRHLAIASDQVVRITQLGSWEPVLRR